MNKILALVGSGEFTSAMDDVDKFLLSNITSPKVAILPTAAGAEADYEKWIRDGEKHFKKLNSSALGIHLTNRKNANDARIIKQLTSCNFFYFSGGDPGYLLDTIKDTKAWKIILQKYTKGAILAGSSAGAMVLGAMVWARVYEYERTGKLLQWEKGLDVVPFGVIPHFKYIQKQFNAKQKADLKRVMPKDVETIGIDENTAFIQFDGKWQIMGNGKVHRPAKL